MNEDLIIKRLLHRIESAHLEHKAADAPLEAIGQTICAFLNSEGGRVFVAAGSDQDARVKEAKIEREVRTAIRPAAFWTTGVEEIEGAHYCIVNVPTGRDRPYTTGGRIYLREGSSDVMAAADSLQTLVEQNYREVERWERQPLPSAGMERLNLKLIKETVELGLKRRNFIFSDSKEPEAILADLALYRRGSITNAAEVLFGLHPAIQFPQVRAQVIVYAASKGSDLIDSRTFTEPISDMIEEMLNMVKKHTPVASLFRGGLRRTDQPAYPEEAVREGLVNAFAHRDYADFRGGISVHMYPDRLVIWNAGQLPPGIKIGDLKREHPSMPHNPDISQVLWLRGYMERVGRGTQSILEWCRTAGLPEPVWESGVGVTLTFKFGAKNDASRLNLREKKLLEDLKPGDVIRLPDYGEKYLVSERQARRDLTELVESGFLNREGNGPATFFVRLHKQPNPAKPGQTRPD